MHWREWSKSNAGYGRRLLNSGLEGARSGREAFLHEKPLALFFSESIRNALAPTAIGVCLGVLGSRSCKRRPSSRAVVSGILGGVLGFGVTLLWESRRLAESVARGAFRNIEEVRAERWLEQNPIDYA